MAQSTSSNTQAPASSLSAEAVSFVPARYKGHKSNAAPGPEQPPTLPQYVTSCYPFVQQQQADQLTGAGAWLGPGRQASQIPSQLSQSQQVLPKGPRGGRGLVQQPPPQVAARMFTAAQGMPPQAAMSPYGAMPPPQGLAGLYPGVPAPVGGWGAAQASLLPMGPAGADLVAAGGFGQSAPRVGGPGGGQPQQQLYYPQVPQYSQQPVLINPSATTTSHSTKKSKKKKESTKTVSVGIQNEAGSLANSGGAKKKAKTKTIICMDAALQTDFGDDINNLTLAEQPHSLYKADRDSRQSWIERYQQETSSESEEVDSDSGYSSPLHRRNQASNGTHPLLGMAIGGPGAAASYQPSVAAVTGVPFTAASMGYAYMTAAPHAIATAPPPLATYSSVVAASAAHGANPFVHHSAYPVQHPPPRQQQQPPPRPAAPPPAVMMATNLPLTRIPQPPRPLPPPPPQPHSQQAYLQNNVPLETAAAASASTNIINKTLSLAATLPSAISSVTSISSTTPSSVTSSLALNLSEPSVSIDGAEEEPGVPGKKKRRRGRRRKNKKAASEDGALSDGPYDLERTRSSSNVSHTSATMDSNDILHFEDEDEFPNLLSAANGMVDNLSNQQSSSLSYSDILKSQVVSPLSQESNLSFSSSDHGKESITASAEFKRVLQNKESKNARKRRKRREIANKAAEDELAEITIEQQVLKEMSTTYKVQTKVATPAPPTPAPPPPQPQPQPAGKKSKQPMSLSIADMITALETRQQQRVIEVHEKKLDLSKPVVNLLDSAAIAKRGKEREIPKVKKPSPLKKVILKEREEKKRLRLLDEPVPDTPSDTSSVTSLPGGTANTDSDLSQDAITISSKTSSLELSLGTPASADMSPISQTSPISMSPLSESPLSSGVNSPIALAGSSYQRSTIISRIHSRRFREYCNQVLDKDIDQCCTQLLQDLVRFQDRIFHKDPIKLKSKRRIVLGLREVTKHLKLKKIKGVVISPNLERIQSKGGLDEALNNIIDMCNDQNVPFVFALGRRALGRACAKLVPVSVVGVFNYDGSEENFKKLIMLTQRAQSAYMEMVEILEHDVNEAAAAVGGVNGSSIMASTSSSSGSGVSVPPLGFPLFTHMGHSRTPSACSAISFTSSILSEPISENYPHSEPETDSRGYEIIKDHKDVVIAGIKAAQQAEEEEQESRSDSASSSNVSGKITTVETLDYEADTEEDHHNMRGSKSSAPSTPRECVTPRAVSIEANGLNSDDDDEDDNDDNEDDDSVHEIDLDTLQDLPHIDSIHSSVVDLSAEILSQHSSKTLDLNAADVLSTHSSKTVEGGCTTPGGRVTPDRGSQRGGGGHMGSAPDLREASTTPTPSTPPAGCGILSKAASGGSSRSAVDKERIETWVMETQRQIERLAINGTIAESESDVDEVEEEDDIVPGAEEDDDDSGSIDFSHSPVIGSNSCNVVTSSGAEKQGFKCRSDTNANTLVASPQKAATASTLESVVR